MTSQQLVFTVGHSTRTLAEVVDMLHASRVTALVDIRSYPSSRHNPQWNQDAIVAGLPADIGYRWERALGGRRYTPSGTPTVNDGWRVKAFRAYADYMATTEFRAGLTSLIEVGAHQVPAIMCSEALPWRCHRRLVADALLVRGVEVRHIMSATSVGEAVLTPFAVVDGSDLSYPAAGV